MSNVDKIFIKENTMKLMAEVSSTNPIASFLS